MEIVAVSTGRPSGGVEVQGPALQTPNGNRRDVGADGRAVESMGGRFRRLDVVGWSPEPEASTASGEHAHGDDRQRGAPGEGEGEETRAVRSSRMRKGSDPWLASSSCDAPRTSRHRRPRYSTRPTLWNKLLVELFAFESWSGNKSALVRNRDRQSHCNTDLNGNRPIETVPSVNISCLSSNPCSSLPGTVVTQSGVERRPTSRQKLLSARALTSRSARAFRRMSDETRA
jgi:hypothetical protein